MIPRTTAGQPPTTPGAMVRLTLKRRVAALSV